MWHRQSDPWARARAWFDTPQGRAFLVAGGLVASAGVAWLLAELAKGQPYYTATDTTPRPGYPPGGWPSPYGHRPPVASPTAQVIPLHAVDRRLSRLEEGVDQMNDNVAELTDSLDFRDPSSSSDDDDDEYDG